jgi:hypothetical protein
VLDADARSVFDRNPRSRVDYYVRHVQASVAVQGSHRELRTDVTLTRFIPFAVAVGEPENAGFRTFALEVIFPATYGEQRTVVLDDTWVERSEFVIVRSTEGGSVERRVSIPDFPIRTE